MMIRKQTVTMAVQSAIDGVKGRIAWFRDDAPVAVPAPRPADVQPEFRLRVGRRSVRIEMTWKQTGNWYIRHFTPTDETEALIVGAVTAALERYRTKRHRWPVSFRLSPPVMETIDVS